MTEHAAVETADHSPDRASHRKDYFRIFWVLTILTIAEVAVAKMKMDHRIVATLLVGMALSKATFVGLYYMHLKYEKRLLLWIAAIPLPLAGFYAVFLGLDAAKLIRAITLPWR